MLVKSFVRERSYTPGRGKIVPRYTPGRRKIVPRICKYYTPGRGKIVPRNLYTPGRGKIVPRNITLLVGEKLCRVI